MYKLNSEILKLERLIAKKIVQLREQAYQSPDKLKSLIDVISTLTNTRNTLLNTHAELVQHYNEIQFSPIKPVLIKIKYLTSDIDPIKKITIGDWIDLRCSETISLSQGDTYNIPLGIAMELPEGYEAWLVGRSSLAGKFKVIPTVGIGVIDNSYCGDNDEWKLPVYAIQDTIINKNDRICQFRIMPIQPNIQFQIVDSLGNPDRGGIGSTGTK